MHFLVFMFLLVMMALSLVGALYLLRCAVQDSKEKGALFWVPGDIFFSLTCMTIFLYLLELFIKFVNA